MISFTLSDKQEKEIKSWQKGHIKRHPDAQWVFTFVSNGIGVVQKCVCSQCGTSVDVTDYDNW